MYIYKAIVVSVYDGDTIRVDIDLGFGIWKKNEPIRLYGIDAPEIRGSERVEGLKSRDWLRTIILNCEFEIKTFKDKKGKYGRYLAEILKDGENINHRLVNEGLAEFKEY